ARILVAKQNVGHSTTTFLARVPNVDNTVDAFEPATHRDRATTDENDDDGLAAGRDALDELFLVSGQTEEGTIAKLALLQSRNHHSDVTSRSGRDRAVDLRAPDTRDTGIPHEFEPSVPRALEILEANRMLGATPEAHRRHSPSKRDLSPVVDHELVVDPEAVAVVAFDADLTDVVAHGRCDGAGPARGIPVER